MRTLKGSHRHAAVEEARKIIRAVEYSSPPIDLSALARHVGVVSVEPREMVGDGYVGRRRDGELVIRYREANSRERNRFTIAHEIAHILISRFTGEDVMANKHRKGFDDEEAAANRVAAELLMPEEMLSQHLSERPPCWSSIATIRGVFNVSTTALLRRIAEVASVDGIFIQATKIGGDGSTGFNFSCRASENPSLLFLRPMRQEIARMLEEFEEGKSTEIEYEVGSTRKTMQCAGRRMTKYDRHEVWFIGWRTV